MFVFIYYVKIVGNTDRSDSDVMFLSFTRPANRNNELMLQLSLRTLPTPPPTQSAIVSWCFSIWRFERKQNRRNEL